MPTKTRNQIQIIYFVNYSLAKRRGEARRRAISKQIFKLSTALNKRAHSITAERDIRIVEIRVQFPMGPSQSGTDGTKNQLLDSFSRRVHPN